MNRQMLVESLKEIGRLVEECLAAVHEQPSVKAKAAMERDRPSKAGHGSAHALDFTSPVRFFMKKHSGDLNGQQKFTLVLAYLAKGKVNAEVKMEDIRSTWSGMKGLLGKFNTGYATWAKDQGWVNSTKAGAYVLMPGWKGIFNRNA